MSDGPAKPVKGPVDLSSRERAEPRAGVSLPGKYLFAGLAAVTATGMSDASNARTLETDIRAAIQAFAGNCFSPFLTAQKAANALQRANTRYDFYDLDPRSSAAPSPAQGRPVTPGTDRRCEVSADTDFTAQAIEGVIRALDAEGIRTTAPVPETHAETPGTALLAARRLNPRRIAVVHVGTRPGPNGVETFMMVERLTPSASSQ